jgi:hypothetical protein
MYQPIPPEIDVKLVFASRCSRIAGADNTTEFSGKILELLPTTDRFSWTKAHVEVRELLDGRIVVLYKGAPVPYKLSSRAAMPDVVWSVP